MGWNGKNASREPGTALYSYIIRIECSEGQVVNLKGSLTLIR